MGLNHQIPKARVPMADLRVHSAMAGLYSEFELGANQRTERKSN